MEEVELIVMCGLQCSGKSTKAKEIAKEKDCDRKTVVLSSNEIREEFKGIDNENVFKILYRRMNQLLENGTNVIVDATNTTIKARKKLFENLKVDCFKICYIMNTPYKECIERLKKRNETDYPHKFDEDVIKKYYYSFEIPFYQEGWDYIEFENIFDDEDSEENIDDLLKLCEGFDQKK